MKKSLALACLLTAFTSLQVAAESGSEVVQRSDIKFQPLNPLRGDQSPQAGMLWGDIKADGPSGFLVKFLDGFSSPPHIHNITYRAVVISGAVHNDDPSAASMWMGPGSFWTQPAGEDHITAANGSDVTVFLDILEGPYLVKHSDEAFDNGERPVNLEESNLVWLDAADAAWVDMPGATASADGPKMTYLWGDVQDGQKNGTFVKLPAGFSGELQTAAPLFRAVTIQGQARVQVSGEPDASSLEVGSYFGSRGDAVHQLACESKDECILYVHAEGKYKVVASRT